MSTPDLHLPEDHPGFSDQDYRTRRAAIAEACASYEPGGPIPDVHYTGEEDEVWHIVSTELAAKHRRYACAAYLDAADRLVLPSRRVPQLSEVDERLQALTGFRLRPVSGLVPTRQFYGALADRVFHSTQYIRHHSVPFYTPEPDIVHEIIGHANMLAGDEFADLYVLAGDASLRANPRSLTNSSAKCSGSLSSSASCTSRTSCAVRSGVTVLVWRERDLSRRGDKALRHCCDGHSRLLHNPVSAGSLRRRGCSNQVIQELSDFLRVLRRRHVRSARNQSVGCHPLNCSPAHWASPSQLVTYEPSDARAALDTPNGLKVSTLLPSRWSMAADSEAS